MLIFPFLIACACFSSDYFLSCLGDETRLSARNIDEVNTKFDELFERIKLLEDKHVQIERNNEIKENQIEELKERFNVLQASRKAAAQPSSREVTREFMSTSGARGL